MKIAIDYTPAYEQGAGIGRLVREQTKALLALYGRDADWRLFIAGYDPKKKFTDIPNIQIKSTRITPRWLARIWHRANLPIPIELFVGRVDLYHATDFVLPPTLFSTKTIVTIHDLSFVKVPNAASPRLKRYLDYVVPRSIQRATHVIADSEATKQDIIQTYGTNPQKISTVLSGIEPRFKRTDDTLAIRQKYSLEGLEYLLCVGTVQPRKNYSRVIHALHLLHQQGIMLHLAIAGGKGWLEDEMYHTIEELHLQQYVHLLGFVDDEDLPALYSGAFCTVFASLYEGFGFPILESMACGTPVITTNISSMPEVAGNATLMVNPYEPEEIYRAVLTLQDAQIRHNLSVQGYHQAHKFTWENSAMSLKAVYEQVLQK